MKKSTAIRLTLVSALAAGAAGCGREEEGPVQTMRGWCDPENETVCSEEPRSGFVPMFIPLYYGGFYYDNRGVARTRPGGPVATSAPRARVSRGGFGRTGAGRSSGS